MAYENNPYIIHETVGSMAAITGKTYSGATSSSQSYSNYISTGSVSVTPTSVSSNVGNVTVIPSTASAAASQAAVTAASYKSQPDEVLAASPMAQAVFEKQAVYASGVSTGSAAATEQALSQASQTSNTPAPSGLNNPMLILGAVTVLFMLTKRR